MTFCCFSSPHLPMPPSISSRSISRVSRRWKLPIESLATIVIYDSSSPIGKAILLRAYHDAGKAGLTEQNIKGGWRGSDLRQVDLAKLSMNRFVLADPETQQTPPQRLKSIGSLRAMPSEGRDDHTTSGPSMLVYSRTGKSIVQCTACSPATEEPKTQYTIQQD